MFFNLKLTIVFLRKRTEKVVADLSAYLFGTKSGQSSCFPEKYMSS